MKNIVLGIDRNSSAGAVATAAGLSRQLGARITIVHVGDRSTLGGDAVEAAASSLKQSRVTFEIRLEHPDARIGIAESLVNIADDLKADMIVLGSRGRSAPIASLFGSVSREVARTARVPVMVVRRAPRKTGPKARLMVVVTEETLGSTELDSSIELARGLNAKVTILHIHGLLENAVEDLLKVPPSHRPDHIANLLLARFKAAGIEAELVVADNHDGLVREITRAALDSGCDLIVIPAGTTYAAERWVLGTVDEEVGRRSGNPVLVAPPIRKTRTGRAGR